jgi:hypothetical protein
LSRCWTRSQRAPGRQLRIRILFVTWVLLLRARPAAALILVYRSQRGRPGRVSCCTHVQPGHAPQYYLYLRSSVAREGTTVVHRWGYKGAAEEIPPAGGGRSSTRRRAAQPAAPCSLGAQQTSTRAGALALILQVQPL